MTTMRTLPPALVLLLAQPAAAHTWYVDVNGTPPGTGSQADPHTSLQDAIARATTPDGDLLLVQPGTYSETVDLLGKDLVVVGEAGAASTILDAGRAQSVVRMVSGETQACVLQGFTLRNGLAPGGTSSAWLGWASSPGRRSTRRSSTATRRTPTARASG
jgi:hypothetical protein